MIVFFDTSSLFKLYHEEADSSVIESVFEAYTLTGICLSDIAKL